MPNKNVSVEAVLLEGYKIEVKSRQHVSIVDQPPAGGGGDAGPTPLEYLFVSLAGVLPQLVRSLPNSSTFLYAGFL